MNFQATIQNLKRKRDQFLEIVLKSLRVLKLAFPRLCDALLMFDWKQFKNKNALLNGLAFDIDAKFTDIVGYMEDKVFSGDNERCMLFFVWLQLITLKL